MNLMSPSMMIMGMIPDMIMVMTLDMVTVTLDTEAATNPMGKILRKKVEHP